MSKKFAKDTFFARLTREELGVTFRDVLLKTQHSNITPNQANTSTLFSRRVSLEIPFVSAAMDTVTEYPMARAMAELGGIGVIHRAMDPAEQARHVMRTKHYLNTRIEMPICVKPTQTIGEVLHMREEKDFTFHSFPVIDQDGRLIGIITKNDFDVCVDKTNTLISDAMTKDPVYADEKITAQLAFALMQKQKKKALPLINENKVVVGMYVYSDLHRILQRENHNAKKPNTDDKGQLRVAAAIGVGDFDRAEKLCKAGVDVLVLQSAHADTDSMLNTLKAIKKNPTFDAIDVVAGNVTEADSAKHLIDGGADGILVGQGGGSICTTRVVAGIGCPQVTAVDQCERILRGCNIPICSDGGIEYSGDAAIALAAGAHSCMVGNLLAGTDEAPGDVFFYQGRPYKAYIGMGSLTKLEQDKTFRERYNLSGTGKSELVPEGVEARVPCKGPVADVITQAVGGIRAMMGYTGAKSIEHLHQTAKFRRITPAGQYESHPHNVEITVEPPNYRTKR